MDFILQSKRFSDYYQILLESVRRKSLDLMNKNAYQDFGPYREIIKSANKRKEKKQ